MDQVGLHIMETLHVAMRIVWVTARHSGGLEGLRLGLGMDEL